MAEVQAAGRPPIAFARGGATEIIRDGETGFLFSERSVDALVAAMERALRTELDQAALIASARRFDRATFDTRMLALIERVVSEPRPRPA
jgi:glycosyltransferase involved in cell wall biosynthesis